VCCVLGVWSVLSVEYVECVECVCVFSELYVMVLMC